MRLVVWLGVERDHKRKGRVGSGEGGMRGVGRSSMVAQTEGESGSKWSAMGLAKGVVLGKVGGQLSEVP